MTDDCDRAWASFVHPWECWGGELSGVCRETRDHAGRTVHGIAEKYHPEAWAEGPPSAARAAEILREHYWEPLRCDGIAWPLSLALVDFGWHSGPVRAARVLQTLAGVKVDGAIGPRTLTRLEAMSPGPLAQALCEARRKYLRVLGGKYQAGWERRLDALEAAISGRPNTKGG